MRFVTSPLLLMLSLAALAPMTTLAAAAQNRFCLQGRQWGYPGNCAFATYAQCRATASGTEATCGINPRNAYARQRGHLGGPRRHY